MASKLRWGILGTGNIARQFATGLLASRRGTLVAVGSRSAQTAATFARAYHVARSYPSYEQLIADSELDVVYISLPNTLHCHWTLEALRAGKHVLCEKPLAMNAAEAERMFAQAEQSARVLMEAFMYRSHPVTLAVMESVRSGAIGEIRLIRSSFCFRTRKIEGNIRFMKDLGGGSLMDIGCYCVNFSRLFGGGEPTKIHAVATMHPGGVDELAAGTLVFPRGILASFTCGISLQADNTAYLCGTEGYIEIPVPWKPPAQQAQFVISRGIPPRMDAGPSGANPTVAASSAAPAPPPRDVRIIDAGGDLYALEADDFAATLLDGKPPRITREDSLGNMTVLDELRNQIAGA